MIITRNNALRWMHCFGTPLTVGLFAVSGVVLFFRWAPQAFHAMHEWLSLVLLAPSPTFGRTGAPWSATCAGAR